MKYITIVNKRTNRLVDYHMDNLNIGDCYAGENVRDRSTMTLVASNVPERAAEEWMRDETRTVPEASEAVCADERPARDS